MNTSGWVYSHERWDTVRIGPPTLLWDNARRRVLDAFSHRRGKPGRRQGRLEGFVPPTILWRVSGPKHDPGFPRSEGWWRGGTLPRGSVAQCPSDRTEKHRSRRNRPPQHPQRPRLLSGPMPRLGLGGGACLDGVLSVGAGHQPQRPRWRQQAHVAAGPAGGVQQGERLIRRH
jgi:hypothetical protein